MRVYVTMKRFLWMTCIPSYDEYFHYLDCRSLSVLPSARFARLAVYSYGITDFFALENMDVTIVKHKSIRFL